MKLDNIMTKYIMTKDVNTPIWEVARIMDEYDIGFVPITMENKIIGVITDRDICTRCCKENSDLQKAVNEFMTKEVITVNINDNINDVLNMMAKHQIKRLIVEDNKLAVGIIALSDVINKYSYMSDIIPTLQKIWELHRNIEEKNVSVQTFEL